MKLIHIGVGEAADERFPNNSHLIHSKTNLLLDCGYSVPRQLWKYTDERDFLDAIYISHRHADHYFGLPALLVRMAEEQRTKKLTIVCQKGVKKLIEEIIKLGYSKLQERFTFPFSIIEVQAGEDLTLNELKLTFAPTIHPVPNLAVRVTDNKHSVCYSGDGQFTPETEKLYENCDLLIQETFFFEQEKQGHSSIKKTIEMAERRKIRALALTHIHRSCRRDKKEEIKKAMKDSTIKVILPEPLDVFKL
ncbi:ribonuclease Z [Candidatus Woesearchaeota archaeon]|nr:ribonuclease Z [Candidatus Woesearchaeota archaeon]